METRTYIALFILLLSVVQNIAALIEARKVLHIPEKIIGGVIDIVQSHKAKPATTTQGPVQNQPVYQGTAQQYPWNPSNSYSNGYQGQFQGQAQYVNYGTYPATGSYPQSTYPANSGQYQSGTVQQGYGGAQGQGQYQVYPQNQGGSQFQGQNQQGYEHNQQTHFQGQQTSGFNVQKPQNQYQGQNQGNYGNQPGQFQGNYQQVQQTQTGQYTGQSVQTGPFVDNQQSGHFVSQSQQNNQFPGQNTQSQGFVNGQGTGWQNGSFQVSGTQQPAGAGPTCVCQAWAKPQPDDGSGKSEDVNTPEVSM